MITEEQFKESMLRMAGLVDEQNATDPNYQPIIVDGEPKGYSFAAAYELVVNGVEEPSGYTEPQLHSNRLDWKLNIRGRRVTEIES